MGRGPLQYYTYVHKQGDDISARSGDITMGRGTLLYMNEATPAREETGIVSQ